MTTISTIAVSGLRAAETRFAIRAENIANANNNNNNNAGYTALRAEQLSTSVGPVVRVSKTDKPRPQETRQPDIDLAEELAGLIAIKHDFRAAAKLLQTADQVSGSLLDILV